MPTITYFPPDETISYSDQMNTLSYENNTLSWKSLSTTNKTAYLRQDIAILYVDGLFKGVMNTWKRSSETIDFQKDLPSVRSGIYESLSYHYSETHTDNNIRSASSTGYSSLHIECTKNDCQQVASDDETNLKDLFKNKELQHQWDELLTYFSIDEDVFEKLKLTQLYQYNDTPLPTLSQDQTDNVINHLWEGLYANYIIELMETKEHQKAHYMPLVLYKEDEIRILYELNGRKEQLIQKINK